MRIASQYCTYITCLAVNYRTLVTEIFHCAKNYAYHFTQNANELLTLRTGVPYCLELTVYD
mgnify:CR=1 FL=1